MEITSRGKVGEREEFFQDHFPGFPVLPGVLMIDILKRSAEEQFPQKKMRLTEVRNVRFANFLRPGDEWESRVEMTGGDEKSSDWKGQLLSGGRPACSARFKLQQD